MKLIKITSVYYANYDDIDDISQEETDSFYGSNCGRWRADDPEIKVLDEPSNDEETRAFEFLSDIN